MTDPDPKPPLFDVLVAGAGVVGLTAALGLARAGLTVALAGPREARDTARTVALLQGSLDQYEGLGLRAAVAARSAPLAAIHIVDDTGSPFAGPPATFRASEIGLDAFGRNVEATVLTGLLEDAVAEAPGVTRFEAPLADHAFGGGHARAMAGDTPLAGRLLVAADGARSPSRAAAGVSTRVDDYHRTAVTARLSHERPHADASTEFHTREGPLTFVPLPRGPDGRDRSSLVWVMSPREATRRSALDDAAFAADLRRAAHGFLGALAVVGPRGGFPLRALAATALVGERLALVGEAAHVMSPIGAQGLNLGLRDVADLVALLGAAHARGEDVGAAGPLAAYARARAPDVALRAAGVDALHRSLLTGLLPVDLARAAGMRALAGIGPLRRLAMRRGLGPTTQAGARA